MEEGDFFQGGDGGGGGGRGFTDFSDDVGLGPPPQHMGSPFRGGRGGGPWRGGGGRGGRGGGHFDNGFGPRGPPPRGFRGGRGGGFGGPPGGPNMRGGSPGQRGFRGGGGHFERGGSPFRFPPGGPGWNGPPPFQMGPGGGGPPMENSNESESGQQIWAETKTDTGSSYYYNTKTRITTWERPEGPNVTVMSHEEWTGMIKGQGGMNKGKFSQENQDNAAVAGQNQSSSPSQGAAGSDENGIRPTEAKPLDTQMRNPPPMLGSAPGQQSMPPGFPPFGGMSVPPPFGINFPQNFPMVPPPWNPMSGTGPPPVGVPPLLGPASDPILQHVDPLVVARAFEWSEHYSPEGKPYYFNVKTQTSVWVKPMPMIELDTAKVIAQQRITQQNMINATKEKERNEKHGEYRERAEAATKKLMASNDKGKPISSTPVTGTPWCIVWTGDKRVFFYNPSTKSSVWERPPELACRNDVDELLSTCPAVKVVPTLPVKKAEATSTSESSSANSAGAAATSTGGGTPATGSFSITISPNVASLDLTPKPAGVVGEKRSLDGTEPPGEAPPPEKKIKTDSQEEENEDDEAESQDKEIITIEDKDDKDVDKDAPNSQGSTLEFEVKAARERAIVPLETRLQQFKEMLIEKQVSAFSTWEKELHKIVFDSRYLLLTSKERKAAFDDYVKERAFEERKEKKARLAQVKERFMKFLESVHVHPKMSYNELSQKYSRDERYKSVEKSRDRESYLSEYIAELKKKEKDARKMEKDKVKDDFLSALQKSISDYHIGWEDAREMVDSSRFDVLASDEKAELFRSFRKQLKITTKSRDRKKKKSKREKRRRENEKKQKGSDAHGGKDAKTVVDDNGEIVEEEGTTPDSEKAEGGESDKVEDISDEEEGAITDDTEDEDRIKKEKAQISIREREKEVQRTLATHLRDRDKERDYYRHEEAVQECQALLTDLVKLSETTWKDAKKAMKRDRRWEPISFLDKEEVELLFNQHLENIEKKKKFRFRELLRENRVKLNSSWKETRRKIREDPRFNKFSTDDRKCEREFTLYLKDLVTSYKSDFRMLLKETKMLTYKTKQLVRENPQMMRDIEAVLEKDKRFLNLETMIDERHRLIVDYIEELGRQGPPPPPTAPDKVSRRLK